MKAKAQKHILRKVNILICQAQNLAINPRTWLGQESDILDISSLHISDQYEVDWLARNVTFTLAWQVCSR